MKRIITMFAGLGVAAVIGLAAITGAGPAEVGGALPLAPTGVAEQDVSDSVLFIEGEPVTPFSADAAQVLPQVGGPLPLAPLGIAEPDLSDSDLFIEGEPVTPVDGDTLGYVVVHNNG